VSRALTSSRPAGDFFALAGRGFPALDGLRGLACLMIFNVHFFAQHSADNYFLSPGSAMYPVARFFHSGVNALDMLFVLSGYLVYGSLSRKRQGFGVFLAGRYKRLLPVALAVNIPALFWIDANWRNVFDNLFFLSLFSDTRLVTFVAWALVYEMYFYVLCGVWLILLRPKGDGPPWKSYLALFGLYLANTLWLHMGQVLSDWRFVGFFVGLGLAMLREGPRGRAFVNRIPAGSWAVFTGLFLFGNWLWSIDALGWLSSTWRPLGLSYFLVNDLVVAGLIAALANAGPDMRTPFSWKGLRAAGAVSYSLIMLHTQWGLPLAVSLLGGKPRTPGGMCLSWAWSFALSFGLAAFLYAHCERFYFTRAR